MTTPDLSQQSLTPIGTTATPYSDAWWLQRLYNQLRPQQRRCQALRDRFDGNAPLPFVSDIQKSAVKWFVSKSRTNYERVIVNAFLSRLRIRGIQTAAGPSDRGDADAFREWKKARGKLFSVDVHDMMLVESMGFLIIGKAESGSVLVTAEDPKLVTVMTDPLDPYKVIAALKLMHDDVHNQDVAYLYLPGRVMVARKNRARIAGSFDVRFNPSAWAWDMNVTNNLGEVVYEGASGPIPWLADTDDDGNVIGGMVPVVPFFTGRDIPHSLGAFEPFIPHIDRLNQQMLQRMTIATIQAFKQRAFKGLPKTDPETGQEIDYNALFTADPGAIWSLPAAAEIWESGAVDITSLVTSYKDDVKDLYSVASVPAYLATDDVNASAESATLKREMTTFTVEMLQDRLEKSHELACELIFRTLGDEARANPGSITIMWAPAERLSVTERANAIAQTKGVMPRYRQLTEIWGLDPDEASQALTELTDDLVLDQQYATALKAAQAGSSPDVGT